MQTCAIKPIAAKLVSLDYLEQKENLSALQSTPAISQVVKLNGFQEYWINRRKQKNTEELWEAGKQKMVSIEKQGEEVGACPSPIFILLL